MDTYENIFVRTEHLIGRDALHVLHNCHAAVFGIGGVGSYTVEALARCGVGTFTLIDHDIVTESNINRQLHALRSTLGQRKVDVMRERIMDINPAAKVEVYPVFYMGGQEFDCKWDFDYVVDAVDNVTAKMQIILTAKNFNLPVISAMGAGNKLDPSRFEVSDIYKTQVCPLAKIMRQLLRKAGVDALKVVYSKESPIVTSEENGRVIGSISYVPATAGLLMAAEVVRDLIEK